MTDLTRQSSSLHLPLLGDLLVDRTTWNALDYLNLYRLFIALLLVALFLTPLLTSVVAQEDIKTARLVTMVYLIVAPVLLLIGRQWKRSPVAQMLLGLGFDLIGTALIVQLMGGVSSGAGVLLIGTVGAAGVLLPRRVALIYAAAGTALLLFQTVQSVISDKQPLSTLTLGAMLGVAYLAITLLGNYLAQRTRETQELAHQRSIDLANLTELNQLIIQRMRTGIGIVDQQDQLLLANDSAWYLAGMPEQRSGRLDAVLPDLHRAYERWQVDGTQTSEPLNLGANVPDVIPRFARFGEGVQSDVLVFLEDASMVSRRAHEITLASLGRLSASIAHEIRNPLAAISHSAQLLAESDQLSSPDAKLSGIIRRQCDRLNDIIENVLQLARQESAKPEEVNIQEWLTEFVDDLRRHQDLADSQLELNVGPCLPAMFDPSQLQQILWNLCQNALKYGREPGKPARVEVFCGARSGAPIIEVRDRGPGVATNLQERIFHPFYTSSTDGTGLGLYLCQQLAQANAAQLEYRDRDGGGSIFRLTMKVSRPERDRQSGPT